MVAAVGDHIVIQRSRLEASPSSTHRGPVARGINILSETREETAERVMLWARTGSDIYHFYPYSLGQTMFT